jgi:hypothetical protein
MGLTPEENPKPQSFKDQGRIKHQASSIKHQASSHARGPLRSWHPSVRICVHPCHLCGMKQNWRFGWCSRSLWRRLQSASPWTEALLMLKCQNVQGEALCKRQAKFGCDGRSLAGSNAWAFSRRTLLSPENPTLNIQGSRKDQDSSLKPGQQPPQPGSLLKNRKGPFQQAVRSCSSPIGLVPSSPGLHRAAGLPWVE